MAVIYLTMDIGAKHQFIVKRSSGATNGSDWAMEDA